MVGLSELQKQEAMRWRELYEHHDKYTFLGLLRENGVDDLVEQAMLEEVALSEARDAEKDFIDTGGKESYVH